MSTSLLYHAFGIRSYHHCSTYFKNGKTIFSVKPNSEKLCCPQCGSKTVTRKGSVVRQFKMEPIGSRASLLEAEIVRVYCDDCDITRQVQLPFADPRRSFTKRFERYALELSKLMTISDVARHLSVGWSVIKDILKRYLKKNIASHASTI